ncbi:hypothetical protein ACOMHN_013157 [Nucella lapillus]
MVISRCSREIESDSDKMATCEEFDCEGSEIDDEVLLCAAAAATSVLSGMCPKLQTLSLRPNYIDRPWQTETSLTEDSLNHIQKLGKCLHTVQLLTYWSFSYIALAQTLVDLPQLRKCAILCPDRCLYFLEHYMYNRSLKDTAGQDIDTDNSWCTRYLPLFQ